MAKSKASQPMERLLRPVDHLTGSTNGASNVKSVLAAAIAGAVLSASASVAQAQLTQIGQLSGFVENVDVSGTPQTPM
jgi:hypothetical protein